MSAKAESSALREQRCRWLASGIPGLQAGEHVNGNGLYFDEPEAALSATRQLALLARMHVLLEEYAQTQFIIATHSPIVLAYPGAQIYSFDRSAVRIIPYGQTDAYLITRRFLHDPARAVRELLAEHLDVP